ncbi:MAG TPA: murein biosynthesis integral membrane protein MurJ [Vicinamibacteria bacterium]|nr:murein biosynthesis integral membrane protein MurJ [Vicinamibacteria bacterium]
MQEPVNDPHRGERGGFLRAAGLISALTLLSRILGLVREQVFAAFVGAGAHADAFQVAFRIPNLLRDLFAEGALSAAFVPTYARELKEGGASRAHQLSSRLLTVLAAVLAVVVLLGFVFTEEVVAFLAPGFAAGKGDLTILLTRIMLPFLPVVSFAAVAMGMLNAQGRFATPAFAPAMFNVVSIAWAAVLWAMGMGAREVAIGWAVGTLLGGLAQFLVQVPPLWKDGWRYRPEWAPGDPGIRRMARLMAPATAGLAAVEVNILVSTRFASHEEGAVAALAYAFRILYLPIGIFGVAVGTVATSGLARRAAEGDTEGLRRTLRDGLQALAFLTLPATVGLVVVGVPIVRLLFERGRFTAADTERTAAALALYAIGLVAYTGVKVLAPAFYAINRPAVALLASVSAVVTNIAVILLLHGRMGFRAIALGTALGSLVNALVLMATFQARVGGLFTTGLVSAVARMGLAAAAMGPVTWWSWRWVEAQAGTHGLPAQLVTGLVPVALGAGAYFLLAHLLRVHEAGALVGGLLRRARGR